MSDNPTLEQKSINSGLFKQSTKHLNKLNDKQTSLVYQSKSDHSIALSSNSFVLSSSSSSPPPSSSQQSATSHTNHYHPIQFASVVASSSTKNNNAKNNNNNNATMPRENIRSIRNQAEKQRRDKLNGFINELAANVPFVTQAKKRQDKTSVLRLAAAYIRIKKLPISQKQHLTSTGTNVLTEFLDSVPGFVLISNCRGKILYVSSGVEKFLGHQDNEVIGHSLDHFLHSNDIENVSQIINRALRDEILQGHSRSNELNFICRLKEKNQSRTEVTYKRMRVTGHITADFTKESSNIFDCVKSELIQPDQLNNSSTTNLSTKSSSHGIVYHEESEYYRNGSFLTPSNFQRLAHVANDIIFLGHVEEMQCNLQTQLKLTDIGFDEYVSRHSLDGTLLHADHRIASILGFLPKEVAGKSAYDYILPEDYSIALFAHKLMLSSSNGTGIVVHRLTGVDDSVIFLQTMGCLKFNESGLVDHFACVSRMLKESDGERELEYFVKRFTPHIQNKSSLELYESMQMDITPYSSRSFNDSSFTSDSRFSLNWTRNEHRRLLPARFERFARDQHQAMLQQRNQSMIVMTSSPQTQIFSTKIEEPDNEQILQVSVANNKLIGINSERVAMQNKIALQKFIRNLDEKSELLMVKSQNHVKNVGRKRSLTTSQDMELSKKGKHSNPNNTFIRSFISADKSLKKQNKNDQNLFKVEPDSEDCLHKSKSISGVDNLPENKYKLAHGQGDYRHMLGARVFTYNHVENANVLSIYTPPSALEAQQRNRLIVDSQNVYSTSNNNTNIATPTSTWSQQTNQSGDLFGSFENSLNSSYLNLQTEQSGNLSQKNSITSDGKTSISLSLSLSTSPTPKNSRTPETSTSSSSLREDLESSNIGCQLDAMQQANDALGNAGPSVNFHLHHHHHHHHHPLKRSSNSSINQFNTDSRSNFSFDYSESTPILPINEESFSHDDNSNGMVDFLSQIGSSNVLPIKLYEVEPFNDHSRETTSQTLSGSGVSQDQSTFVSTQSDDLQNGDNSYLSSGQNNNYSSSTFYQYSIDPEVQFGQQFNGDFMSKTAFFHNKLLHENNFNDHHANTQDQCDQAILTMSGETNLYSYENNLTTYQSPYFMDMAMFPNKKVDASFLLNQPENSYDFTDIMNSVLYSPETLFPNKIDPDSLSSIQSDADLSETLSGKCVNNNSTSNDNASDIEKFH